MLEQASTQLRNAIIATSQCLQQEHEILATPTCFCLLDFNHGK